MFRGVNLENIKLGQIFGSSKNGSWALVDARNFFGWFKWSLNQSIGSFSCNPHFALLRTDERSDILGNVSNHWGMVTYNFFRNNFFGSLIRTRSGAEFVMRYTHFCILRPLDIL